MNEPKPSLLIIGAGIIGLTLGWRARQAGCLVTIVEKNKAGFEASWAAAGMLAAGAEILPESEILVPFGRTSQLMWRDFAKEVEATSGVDVGYRGEGSLFLALDDEEKAQALGCYERAKQFDIPCQILNAQELEQLEPSIISPSLCVHYEDDHQVDARRVTWALRDAFLKSGGLLIEEAGEVGLYRRGGDICGVEYGQTCLEADVTVVAAGAWSGSLVEEQLDIAIGVTPVKGQVIALKSAETATWPAHVVWGGGSYLVPRNDGTLVVGATTEAEAGYDRQLTNGSCEQLLQGVRRSLRDISGCKVVDQWCGFRPAAPDFLPIIGPVQDERVFVATGNYRNGILHAPLMGEILVEWLNSGTMSALARPFGPERFDA